MTESTDSVIRRIEDAVKDSHGGLPPGWNLAQLYRDTPFLFVLDCDTCNVPVGRWQVPAEQLDRFGFEVSSSLLAHHHWMEWSWQSGRRYAVVGESNPCILGEMGSR